MGLRLGGRDLRSLLKNLNTQGPTGGEEACELGMSDMNMREELDTLLLGAGV